MVKSLHILDDVSADSNDQTSKITSELEESSLLSSQPHASVTVPTTSVESPSMPQTHSSKFLVEHGEEPSLCIAVIGATGELARRKIFPALFALYYSGFLPEVGWLCCRCPARLLWAFLLWHYHQSMINMVLACTMKILFGQEPSYTKLFYISLSKKVFPSFIVLLFDCRM